MSEPANYVRLSALRVDNRPGTGYWRVSAPNRAAVLAAGGVLLSFGVMTLLGGAAVTLLDLASYHPPKYDSLPKGLLTGLVGIPLMLGGLMIIPGVARLTRPRVEIPVGESGMSYVNNLAVEAMLLDATAHTTPAPRRRDKRSTDSSVTPVAQSPGEAPVITEGQVSELLSDGRCPQATRGLRALDETSRQPHLLIWFCRAYSQCGLARDAVAACGAVLKAKDTFSNGEQEDATRLLALASARSLPPLNADGWQPPPFPASSPMEEPAPAPVAPASPLPKPQPQSPSTGSGGKP